MFLFSHLLKLLLWESYKQAKSDIREMIEIVQGLFIQSTTKYPYDLKTRSWIVEQTVPPKIFVSQSIFIIGEVILIKNTRWFWPEKNPKQATPGKKIAQGNFKPLCCCNFTQNIRNILFQLVTKLKKKYIVSISY